MSRPRKYNADWFKHSNNLRLDEKIQVLLNEYGAEGYGIHIATMELLTGSDHHKAKLNAIDIRVFASSIRTNAELINKVWSLLHELGLYQVKQTGNYTHIEYKNLTEGLQIVARKREADREAAAEKPQKKQKKFLASENPPKKTHVSDTENHVLETETPQTDNEKPQRERERENKSKNIEREREKEKVISPSIFNQSLLNELFIKHKILLIENHVSRPTDLLPITEKFISFQAKKQKTWATEKDCVEHFEKWLPSELKTIKPKFKLPNIYASTTK